ncbi:hypothetical protein GJAV_G00005910 [Gymnothorax javanicus]|nr:hypothetical protein GJAV_G00005910 [Gymnothorax javanicus]
MTPPLRSVWIVVTLTVGAVSVIFPQSGTAFPSGPFITSINGPDTVIAGEETSYTCSADCTPPCHYTWTVDGDTLKASTQKVGKTPPAGQRKCKCKTQCLYSLLLAKSHL